jgi:hypothetical protein
MRIILGDLLDLLGDFLLVSSSTRFSAYHDKAVAGFDEPWLCGD